MAAETECLQELYTQLEAQPENIDLHELLLATWLDKGDMDAANGIADQLAALDPQNRAAKDFFQRPTSDGAPGGQEERPGEEHPAPSRAPDAGPAATATTAATAVIETPSDPEGLAQSYAELVGEAAGLLGDIAALDALGGPRTSDAKAEFDLRAISAGRFSAVVHIHVRPVRAVARHIAKEPGRCLELAILDFETVHNALPPNADETRKRLLHRKTLLAAALPAAMGPRLATALYHVEHKCLGRRFHNAETLLLQEPIAAIPPANFFVTEDNYAWDIEELVQALAAHDGVMRNPLSRDMFCEADVRAILSHPLGQSLRPLQLAQAQLKQGVRADTIARVAALGKLMLETEDSAACVRAIDEFLAYMATLPENETKTIDSLKIPAKDKMNGSAYDTTIGESIRDAKAGTTCFHKTGDFLTQAAQHLNE